MKIVTYSALTLALATGFASGVHAETQLGDNLTFSGFGTVGVVQTNSDAGQYVRENQPMGATTTQSGMVDSNLGLQLTGKANAWLSGTVQTLTMQRATNDMSTQFEYAFVKVTPIEGLAIRAGKMALPVFLVSDSRRIGYANTALRPANELYGLDILNGGLKGADIAYRMPVLGDSLTVSALAGDGLTEASTIPNLDIKNIRGGSATWEGDWYTLRASYVEAQPQLGPLLGTFLPATANIQGEVYKFTSFGFSVDRANVVLQGEYAKRRSSNSPTVIDADGWYLLAGYRFDKFLPYLQYGERVSKDDSVVAPQTTKAIGLRWDAFKSADIKFQLENVDTKGTAGASFVTPGSSVINSPVTTFSVAVDFVF